MAWHDRRVAVDALTLDRLCALVAAGEGVDFDVSLCVVDDAEIRRINGEFLGHDYETDVITFDLGDGPAPRGQEPAAAAGAPPPVSGEVVVSAEFAERHAAALGHDAATELLFYVCHGLLHLCGWDDAEAADRDRMLARQTEYLAALGRPVAG